MPKRFGSKKKFHQTSHIQMYNQKLTNNHIGVMQAPLAQTLKKFSKYHRPYEQMPKGTTPSFEQQESQQQRSALSVRAQTQSKPRPRPSVLPAGSHTQAQNSTTHSKSNSRIIKVKQQLSVGKDSIGSNLFQADHLPCLNSSRDMSQSSVPKFDYNSTNSVWRDFYINKNQHRSIDKNVTTLNQIWLNKRMTKVKQDTTLPLVNIPESPSYRSVSKQSPNGGITRKTGVEQQYLRFLDNKRK